MTHVSIDLTVNGRAVRETVQARMTLVDFVRERLDLTGTHVGCAHGVCGACLVLIDGVAARSCVMLAASADGRAVETIEGLSERGATRNLAEAFTRHGGLQCGFCTPGILVAAHALLAETTRPTRDGIREALAGHICRCTGYEPIVDAVADAAAGRQDAGP